MLLLIYLLYIKLMICHIIVLSNTQGYLTIFSTTNVPHSPIILMSRITIFILTILIFDYSYIYILAII